MGEKARLEPIKLRPRPHFCHRFKRYADSRNDYSGDREMGEGFDRTGSYRLAFLFCGVATVVAALAMLRLGSYPVFSKY
ncbi:MAG: hypothetical protein J2P21_23840 [Chloracidobacterium sp.]|nr:hypothetical protein [Chloracidobacterium sp.]